MIELASGARFMRRDEVKIFRGNSDAHIERLQHFPESSRPPVADEAPPSSGPQSKDVLDYSNQRPQRRRWWHVLETPVADVVGLCLLILFASTLLLSSWENLGFALSSFVVLAGVALPSLWIISWWVKRRINR